MKVLLINPSQENFLNYKVGWIFGLRDVGYYQPLGLLYIATYLKKKSPDLEVKLIDAASPNMPYGELEKRVQEFLPDIVGIASYTQTFIDTIKSAEIVKRVNPFAHVTLGGNHLFYFPRESLSHAVVDSIILGDGEIRFYQLVARIGKQLPLEDIEGVYTKKNIQSLDDHFDKSRFLMKDIDDLPFPDRSLLKGYNYRNLLTLGKKLTTIVSSRGCPYSCTFCPQRLESYRQRSAKSVLDEIEQCLDQGYTDFFFVEDTFNINKKKVMDFCGEVKRRGLEFSWCCKARVSNLDVETLAAMKASGCYLINLGIETGTDRGLQKLNKGITTQMMRAVASDCRKLNIKTFGYFMIGLPFEKTVDEAKRNIDFLLSLDLDYININPLCPMPATPLFEAGVRKGIVSLLPWKKLVSECENFVPMYWEEHLSKDEILKLRTWATLKFYFRISYILKQFFQDISMKKYVYMSSVAMNMVKGFFREKRIEG
jgi:radical SAM superfamily enzyme YgiQ (UPF0313 family)